MWKRFLSRNKENGIYVYINSRFFLSDNCLRLHHNLLLLVFQLYFEKSSAYQTDRGDKMAGFRGGRDVAILWVKYSYYSPTHAL